jgi:hypothetical protein
MKKSFVIVIGLPFAVGCFAAGAIETIGDGQGTGGSHVGNGGASGSAATGAGGSGDNATGGGNATGGAGSTAPPGSTPGLSSDGGSIPTGASGLPCDVQAVLQSRCQSCHSNPPVGAAVGSLVTYADLTASSRAFPTQIVAQRAVARMQDNLAPMPPAPAVRATSAQIATMQAWVAAAWPPGSCADAGGGPSTGTGADAGNPFDTPAVCTSNRTAPGGDESANMAPGQACITCHATNEAPDFTIAGTAYPTAHEPNNCNGSAGPTGNGSVVIVDANNVTITIPINAVGNFSSTRAIARPFHAKVVVGTRERVMVAAQTVGDCNSCHTQTGASSAPGRIVLP